MTIIDAQVHIWPPETPERLYITEDASKPHKPIPLTRERLLEEMAAAQVDRAILVPPSWEGYRNDYALQAARLHSDRLSTIRPAKANSRLGSTNQACSGFASAFAIAGPIRFSMTAQPIGSGATANGTIFR